MTENNKTLELTLKKTTLRVLNVDEFDFVGGASDGFVTIDSGITPTIITDGGTSNNCP